MSAMSNKDFNVENLPRTRRMQFLDILNTRFLLLVLIGLITILSSLPLIALIAFRDIAIVNVSNAFLEEKIDSETLVAQTNNLRIIYHLGLFVALPFIALALSGNLRVMRQLIWGEGVFYREDFKMGLKQNALCFILCSEIFAIFSFVQYLIRILIGGYIAPGISYGIELIAIFPLIMTYCYSHTIYTNTFVNSLKNSFIMTFKNLPEVFLFFILTYGVVFLKYIENSLVKMIILVILLVFYIPLALLASFLSQMHIYDKDFNIRYHKDLYKRGLYISDKKIDEPTWKGGNQ